MTRWAVRSMLEISAAKKPDKTAEGKKDPRFASLNTLASQRSVPLKTSAILARRPNVARKVSSLFSALTLSSLYITCKCNDLAEGIVGE